jgi:hypothetical protein
LTFSNVVQSADTIKNSSYQFWVLQVVGSNPAAPTKNTIDAPWNSGPGMWSSLPGPMKSEQLAGIFTSQEAAEAWIRDRAALWPASRGH